MKCTEEHCNAPAEFRYVWRWGDAGACCAEHQSIVRTRAGQLDTAVSFVAITVPRDELSQAVQIIRDLAGDLRLRIEEGVSQNPATLRLAEELARRVRNCPAPFGDALVAVREVGNALVADANDTARQAAHRERQALDRIKDLERVCVQAEQALATERGQSQKQIEALRTSLTQAHLQIAELEQKLSDPDPTPTEPAPASLVDPEVFTVDDDQEDELPEVKGGEAGSA